LLDPPVAAVDFFRHRSRFQQQKRISDLLGQQALVLFDRQHIVGLLLDNERGDFALTAHRIDGHHGAGQFKRMQQLWNGRDLVGFFLGLALPEHQPVALGPG
jgi:hypothetical protein